ncbi:VWA domain-containing protein [Desulfococcaceae bacterium HSG9]|nr:VWA domain-containing protein [Desulfococcaceae bacterium HSG9]
MFRFASPFYFLLLIAVPAALWFHKKRMRRPVMKIGSVSSVRGLKGSLALKSAWILSFLKYTAFILLVTAMARPQWGTRHTSVLTEGVNIILAVDLSESMAALDFKRKGNIVNRLEAVKGVVQNFIAKRDGDRIGLVVFGSQAYTQLPLNRDYNTIATILAELKIGSAGPATAIGDAIGISLKRLKDIKSKSNIIILLTDGRSNAGELSPDAAAAIAEQTDVKIYTIGVGSKGKAPFLVNHPILGQRYVYQQVDIDEVTLKEIAEKTGGLYFRAENTGSLQKIYNIIDRMEKTEVKVKSYAEYREFYSYLLIIALILMAVRVLLVNTKYLRMP